MRESKAYLMRSYEVVDSIVVLVLKKAVFSLDIISTIPGYLCKQIFWCLTMLGSALMVGSGEELQISVCETITCIFEVLEVCIRHISII